VDGVVELAAAERLPEARVAVARQLWRELRDTLAHD
jgi:hypothetical protein